MSPLMHWNPPMEQCSIRVPDGIQYFQEHKALCIHTRNLPHWRQEGATYFVTFRLADSIPAAVMEEMKRAAQQWNERVEDEIKRRGSLSATVAEAWEAFQRQQWVLAERTADECHGSCVLADDNLRQLVVDAIMFFEGERQTMDALVVMPNHLHMLVTPEAPWSLDKLGQSWKGFTARKINARLGRTGSLWQQESFDRIVRDAAHFGRVVRYIWHNPTNAKLTEARSTVGIADRCILKSDDVIREASPSAEADPW